MWTQSSGFSTTTIHVHHLVGMLALLIINSQFLYVLRFPFNTSSNECVKLFSICILKDSIYNCHRAEITKQLEILFTKIVTYKIMLTY